MTAVNSSRGRILPIAEQTVVDVGERAIVDIAHDQTAAFEEDLDSLGVVTGTELKVTSFGRMANIGDLIPARFSLQVPLHESDAERPNHQSGLMIASARAGRIRQKTARNGEKHAAKKQAKAASNTP